MPTQTLPHATMMKSQAPKAASDLRLTLPCTMAGVRWPFPPLPINTRGGSANGGRKEEEGKAVNVCWRNRKRKRKEKGEKL
ncbi:hypothetical protein D5086_010892 [Populus alba]|uniref:Uncharacterized protein n=1 Tax=Populus alba TaxID=43335 RepID=A0ACC4CAM2_POPAL